MTQSGAQWVVGFLCLAGFVAQSLLGLRWPALEALQSRDNYKIVSGAVLALFLAVQWHLPVLRLLGYKGSTRSQLSRHKWLGAFAPALFYVHSTGLGYAFMYVLSLSYMGNSVVGLLNQESLRIKGRRYAFIWMFFHVTLSMAVTALTAVHVYGVFYFE